MSPSVLSSLIPDSILIPEPCSFSSLTLPPSRVMSDGANARLRSEEGRARGDAAAAAAGGGIQALTASKSKSSPHTTQDGRTRTEGERPTREAEEGNGLGELWLRRRRRCCCPSGGRGGGWRARSRRRQKMKWTTMAQLKNSSSQRKKERKRGGGTLAALLFTGEAGRKE